MQLWLPTYVSQQICWKIITFHAVRISIELQAQALITSISLLSRQCTEWKVCVGNVPSRRILCLFWTWKCFQLSNVNTRKAHKFESTAGQIYWSSVLKLTYKCSQRMITLYCKIWSAGRRVEAHTFCNVTLRKKPWP